MVTRRWIAAAVTACALPALALAPSAISVAQETGNAFADVTGVVAKVNRTGGITVSGVISCRAAVEKWEADGGTVPDGILHVGYSWTARQPVKKGAYPVATFESSHLTPCYDTANPGEVFPWESTPYGMTTPLSMYPDYGKFTKGPVYVEVRFEGGEVIQNGQGIGHVEVFYQGGFELLAQRS